MAVQTVDFSSLRFNLKKISESRLLSQYHDSKILKQLLGAFTEEIQELMDALVDLMEYRTISKARGSSLDAIGRIVGQPRTIYQYDSNFWFTPDDVGLSPDNGYWWMSPYPQALEQDMDDITYSKWLWMKILSNHNLFSSYPEIKEDIYDGLGEIVEIEQDGMMTGKIYCKNEISLTNYVLLDYHRNTNVVDNDFFFEYPATTKISSKVKV